MDKFRIIWVSQSVCKKHYKIDWMRCDKCTNGSYRIFDNNKGKIVGMCYDTKVEAQIESDAFEKHNYLDKIMKNYEKEVVNALYLYFYRVLISEAEVSMEINSITIDGYETPVLWNFSWVATHPNRGCFVFSDEEGIEIHATPYYASAEGCFYMIYENNKVIKKGVFGLKVTGNAQKDFDFYIAEIWNLTIDLKKYKKIYNL